MDLVSRRVAERKWDSLEASQKNPSVFLVLKVLEDEDERIELTLVQFSWLALFDDDEIHLANRPVCTAPVFRLMAHGDTVRLFEVPLLAFHEGRCGPIDLLVGVLQPQQQQQQPQQQTRRSRLFSIRVNDDDVRDIFASDFLPVQPLWRDTVVPVVNTSFSVFTSNVDATTAADVLLLCAVLDPWYKLNVATAKEFMLPDGTTWPVKGFKYDYRHGFHKRTLKLPDIELVQRCMGEKERSQRRCAAVHEELAARVWHPSRISALGGMEIIDDL